MFPYLKSPQIPIAKNPISAKTNLFILYPYRIPQSHYPIQFHTKHNSNPTISAPPWSVKSRILPMKSLPVYLHHASSIQHHLSMCTEQNIVYCDTMLLSHVHNYWSGSEKRVPIMWMWRRKVDI